MVEADGAADSANNCVWLAKTKTGWESRAKEIVADTGRPAKDPFGGMCAANCGKPASTRISWANEAKETAAGIARPVEGGCKGR